MGYQECGKICRHCEHYGGSTMDEGDKRAYKCNLNPAMPFRTNEDASCNHWQEQGIDLDDLLAEVTPENVRQCQV
ncbi:hypothetical protein [Neptuniibacter sp. QD37_11]|uniref:hypothetical protein n=1 Tax=Neptuniibacter sp. QD37_11 TaxID=3398209 RepID=UPI0039F54DEE